MSISEDNEHVISCIAVDGKIHVCLPWEKVTACEDNYKVTSKDVTENDRINRFNCYECNY
jgi:hypothetical protein